MQNKMNPVHPGEILQEEMCERELTASALARAMRVPVNRITSIVNGQRNITPETAILLAQFFKTSPEFWLNLQQTWGLRKAEVRLRLESTRVATIHK